MHILQTYLHYPLVCESYEPGLRLRAFLLPTNKVIIRIDRSALIVSSCAPSESQPLDWLVQLRAAAASESSFVTS